jgi:hypothetical protein
VLPEPLALPLNQLAEGSNPSRPTSKIKDLATSVKSFAFSVEEFVWEFPRECCTKNQRHLHTLLCMINEYLEKAPFRLTSIILI